MDRETTKQAELSVNFVDFIVGPFFMALTSLLPKVHLCCELMRDNRTEWCRRIETDIQARSNLSEEQKIEEITKWKRRELAFNEVVTPLIDQAKGKMVTLCSFSCLSYCLHQSNHLTLTSFKLQNGRRRSTLMVLSEITAASKAKDAATTKDSQAALDNDDSDGE